MARKNKGPQALDVLVDLVARFPWWVGVLLAIASYVVLREVANTKPPPINGMGQLSEMVTRSFVTWLAYVGQYLLPFVFVVGAIMSFVHRRRAGQLHSDALNRSDGIALMTWRDFEVLVAEHFRRQGFSVTETGGGGPDGGVDVLIRRGSDRYLVQCKHWRARRVGVEPVRELYGLMAAQRMAGGFVVTSGDFTDEARRFANGREVELINGAALQRNLRAQAPRQSPKAAVLPAPAPAQQAADLHRLGFEVTQPMGFEDTTIENTTPSSHAVSGNVCPVCGATMVLRQARTGKNAGLSFWGCTQFVKTRCRGTRPAQQ